MDGLGGLDLKNHHAYGFPNLGLKIGARLVRLARMEGTCNTLNFITLINKEQFENF